MRSIGLYIHIPFCRRKCLYCDFPSYAGLEDLHEPYTAALCREISGKGGLFAGAVVDTVYVGGGTPTMLPPRSIARILECVYTSFSMATDVEITVEANPGTVDKCNIGILKSYGVNRISFGVQTFSDKLLTAIGRIHSAQEARDAVAASQQAGLDNINIDLMYGLPGQSLQEFHQDMEQAAGLEVRHISAYGLKIEENTPFDVLYKNGELMLPDEAVEESMYDLAVNLLPQLDFTRYEISNYSRPGRECRHNLKYWHYRPYIGVGAAAHSFIDGERRANIPDVGLYIKATASGQSPVAFRESSDCLTAMAEYIFLALRTVEGMNYQDFFRQFNENFNDRHGAKAIEFIKKGLLTGNNDGIRLTERGMKYGNTVFAAFLPDRP